MLPRSARLSVAKFDAVIEKGGATHSPFFILRTLKVGGVGAGGLVIEDAPRVAAVVPVKVCKKAVDRNHLRRQIYEIVQPMLPALVPNIQAIIFAKKGAEKATFAELTVSIREIFVKARLMK